MNSPQTVTVFALLLIGGCWRANPLFGLDTEGEGTVGAADDGRPPGTEGPTTSGADGGSRGGSSGGLSTTHGVTDSATAGTTQAPGSTGSVVSSSGPVSTTSGAESDTGKGDGGSMGNCCLSNGSPGCDDPDTEACVCDADPLCCTGRWDAPCVMVATMACGHDCSLVSDCCDPHPEPGCAVLEIEECVCFDPSLASCCTEEWHKDCVDAAPECGAVCASP